MATKKKRKADPLEANFLGKWRVYREMSQEQLGAAAGTTKSVISLLESGGRKLSPKWARRLAPPLGIKPGWLLDVDPDTVNRDVLEIWAEIPESAQGQSLDVLKTFAKKRA